VRSRLGGGWKQIAHPRSSGASSRFLASLHDGFRRLLGCPGGLRWMLIRGPRGRLGAEPGAFMSPGLKRDYWLGQSAGFGVEADGRRIGLVEDVLYRSSIDVPDHVLLRVGILGRHSVVVPSDRVAAVIPRQRRLIVESQALDGTAVSRRGAHYRLVARLMHSRRRRR
jgi:hypothetical protein